MLKILVRVVIIIFLALASFNIANAFSIGSPFGGTIINTKAIEIQTLESANFTCIVPGNTIQITPIGSYPTSYFYAVPPRTNTTPSSGQWILGIYSGQMVITCIYKGYPPIIKIVNLPIITLFGTSGGVAA